jgi:hypothetical protein
MKHTVHCLLLGTLLMASLSAFAQYSWIDSAGRRVFSDQPPPADIPPKDILSKPGMPVAESPLTAPDEAASKTSKQGQDKALEEKKKASDAAAAAKNKAEEQKLAMERAENCQRAKIALAGLQSGARIAQFNAQGERYYMTDEQRAAEIQRMQGVAQSDCH